MQNLYELVLSRPADVNGFQTELKLLTSGGPVGQVFTDLYTSTEFKAESQPVASILESFFPGTLDLGAFRNSVQLQTTNPVLIKAIKQRQQQIAAFDHVKISQIPADAVTASGSGLDPDISPQNAAIQVDRVAAARHVSPAAIRALVTQFTQGRTLGFLGEPRVDVLTLNIALDQRYPFHG